VSRTNNPFVTTPRPAAFARAWGSRLVTFERAGHLNADAGFGPWPEGRRLLAELTKG
jgi:serine hydrolase